MSASIRRSEYSEYFVPEYGVVVATIIVIVFNMAEVLFKPRLSVVKARQLFITAADREACKHNACVMCR